MKGERERAKRGDRQTEGGKGKKNRQHFNCFLKKRKKKKKVEMKNRVGPEAHGEILAGRIARAYEKGRPEAQQGDEYWFFIKHFASISREGQKRRDRERAGETAAVKEGKRE